MLANKNAQLVLSLLSLGAGLILCLTTSAWATNLRALQPVQDPTGQAGEALSEGQLSSNADHYSVHYTVLGDPLAALEEADLEVRVFDRKGKPVEVDLELTASMPHHNHGLSRLPTVARTGLGEFSVGGLFLHMPGYWEVYFDLTLGAVTERAETFIEVE